MSLFGKDRNFGLDMVRAVSISLVLYNHSGGVFSFLSGVLGVEVFFVLSGFLIGQILYKSFALNENISTKNLFGFWKRRWWRTLPLYYLVIITAFILCGACIGKNILYYIFFLQNHFYGIQFYSVTWSLVVEEWFYLLVPILLFAFYKMNINKKKVLMYLGGFIAAITLLKIVWVLKMDTPFSGIRASVPLRLDSLCYGVLLAFAKQMKPLWYDKMKNPVFFIISLVAITGCMFLLNDANHNNSIIDTAPLLRACWFSLLSISILFLIPFMEANLFINEKLAAQKWIWFPFTLISVLTYSIYLLHMPLKGFYYSYLNFLPFPGIMSLAFLFICSFLVYRFYEHPMTQLREKL